MNTKLYRISDILISLSGQKMSIAEHPYYLALQTNQKNVYESHKKSKHQMKKPTSNWKTYIDLKNKISKNGYKPRSSDYITLKKNSHGVWYCNHGRHRLCILRYLYGTQLQLVTIKHRHKKRYVIDINSSLTSGRTFL